MGLREQCASVAVVCGCNDYGVNELLSSLRKVLCKELRYWQVRTDVRNDLNVTEF